MMFMLVTLGFFPNPPPDFLEGRRLPARLFIMSGRRRAGAASPAARRLASADGTREATNAAASGAGAAASAARRANASGIMAEERAVYPARGDLAGTRPTCLDLDG